MQGSGVFRRGQAFAALQEYLAATLTDDIEQPMFRKRDGRRLQSWAIQKTIREMCVKIDQLPIGIHALRQSLALRFADAGLSIHSMRRVLGYCDSEQSLVIMRLTRDLPTPPRLSSRDRVISVVSKVIARLASIARSVAAQGLPGRRRDPLWREGLLVTA